MSHSKSEAKDISPWLTLSGLDFTSPPVSLFLLDIHHSCQTDSLRRAYFRLSYSLALSAQPGKNKYLLGGQIGGSKPGPTDVQSTGSHFGMRAHFCEAGPSAGVAPFLSECPQLVGRWIYGKLTEAQGQANKQNSSS